MAKKSRSGWRYGIGYELKGRPAEKQPDKIYSRDTVSYQEYMKDHARWEKKGNEDKVSKHDDKSTERNAASPRSATKAKRINKNKTRYSLQSPSEKRSISASRLSEEEAAVLLRHMDFYRALESGERAPSTEAQAHFLEVCRGLATPQTVHETAYLKYIALKKRAPDDINKSGLYSRRRLCDYM